ncbi:hypothetical protein O0L34_g9248 [Tuta absoluta]|nr:hypothetical protein O0L34_g9248 [Tuta absoluta]
MTLKEIKTFIGILLIMGCINLPKIRMYWSKQYGVQIIKDAMTRSRFFSIRANLKVVYDPEVTPQDKTNRIWKVAPLFNAILRGFHSQPREDNISIDEMIIPFSGQCGIRQYCPGKPNPVGIKVFVLANPNGLVCDMVVYQGDTTFQDLKAQGFTLDESAILKLCETLVPGHHIYFDRYFTTIRLTETLLKKGFHGTGTIQRNRIPKDCEFSPEKEFKKKSRGTSETLSSLDGTIAVTR